MEKEDFGKLWYLKRINLLIWCQVIYLLPFQECHVKPPLFRFFSYLS